MKKIIAAALALTLAAGLLSGCGGSSDEKTIVIGATPTPHAEILEQAAPLLEAKGYQLEIKEFTDYVQPNPALNDGELDANFFQHKLYLDNFNEERGMKLTSAGAVHYEPFGIYPGKTASLDALADGAVVAVPNDGTNEGRALNLLQANGLIKLKDGAGYTAPVKDIVENPKNLQVKEIEAAQLARSLEDVDIACINGNYALDAGLNVKDDALAIEEGGETSENSYGNVVAVREGDENSDKIKALMEVLKSDEIKKFIEEHYNGAVVPV